MSFDLYYSLRLIDKTNIMKLFITSVCILMLTAFSSFAQASQMATLFHDGTITNFSSGTAFADAMEAAVDGDVISLSSGMFTAVDIKKNVTVRGAGMTVDGYNDNELPTILSGNVLISFPQSTSNKLTLEGLVFTGIISIRNADNFTAYKCQFKNIHSESATNSYSWKNFKFLHCIISEISNDYITDSSLDFLNCVIGEKGDFDNSDCLKQFTNCVLYIGASIEQSNIINSIIIMQKGSAYRSTIHSSCSVNHCIIAKCDKYYAQNGGNRFLGDTEGIFAESGFYKLTPVMLEFKGNDDTQVGIHGGNMPFDPVTSRPRITRFDVSSQTTADGKLSIDIEISNDK